MNHAFRRIRTAAVLLCVCTASAVIGQEPVLVAPIQTALNSFTENAFQQHVNVLASDSLEGREAGSRGGRAAAAYIVDQLRKLKMQPAGPNGEYLQPFGGAADYRNILAVIPGSDPVLRNEYIVIGGHYDHVGYGNATNSYGPFGQIHNGADDNASGCATLLELMRAIKTSGIQPKRSLLFAFWDGEEKNLLGSKYFVAVPLIPLAQIKLKINVDMVGRLTESRVEFLGTRTAPGLRRFVSERNLEELVIDFKWEIIGDSDHYPFVQKQIPYIMPFTGKHADYHRPSDDADKVNPKGMRRIARVLLRILVDSADMEKVPAYRARCRVESEGTRRGFERPLPTVQPRLGIQQAPDTGSGVIVGSIVANTPAAQNGIRPGDQILQFNERDVTHGNFRMLVQVATSPATLKVVRNGETVTLRVQLTGPPRRVGIGWRTDAAESGTMLLTRVVAGSPAATAGLRVGDRIYALNGRPPVSDEEFLTDTQNAVQLPLTVERMGQLFSTTVVLPKPVAVP